MGLDVRRKNCVVVGGGDVGTRKAHTLCRAGAIVTVISPRVTRELAHEIEAGQVRWVQDSFREEHLRGAYFVVAATDVQALNATAVGLAARCGALVCDASSAERSELIFGAVHDPELEGGLDEDTLELLGENLLKKGLVEDFEL